MKFCFSLIGFCRGHGTRYETILLFPTTLEETLLPSLGKHSAGPIGKAIYKRISLNAPSGPRGVTLFFLEIKFFIFESVTYVSFSH